ncbi:unnamed protein product [Pocillopora meandrina]|uniref:EGF-like domain-containing protein n=1 Tax=Pocillopora meandrina TaxID=46732 RepID=A0AAU9X9D6_9CNID|nr:unnamed protein product [Pocillopora meandrina]
MVFAGKRLVNHRIRSIEVMEKRFCRALCFMEPDCVSINLDKRVDGSGNYKCELNNVTHEGHEHELREEENSSYHAAKSACVKNSCKNNATCQSGFNDKGYRCLCTAEFKGRHCDQDVDECSSGFHSCSADAVCNNTKGSYYCTCKPGYSGDGWSCNDINECIEGISNCSIDAVCNNTKGSYNCTCKPGYSGNGQTCKDIDECSTGNDNCSANSECSNTKGSYSCTCKPGYSGDGRTCKDFDECSTAETHNCNADAVCNNTMGSYTCSCKTGYFGDGWTCQGKCPLFACFYNVKFTITDFLTDIDECATGKQKCSADAECNNTKGSYNCTCKPGYSGDGRTCNGKFSPSSWRCVINRSNVSGVMTLYLDSKPISIFCHMGNFGCGDGGWTPVMKTDGNKITFHYNSSLWISKSDYNLPGGATGFDRQETKLPTFWNTPFEKICLGMKIDNLTNFILVNKTAVSLHSLIADGKYRNTSLGLKLWKSLIGSNASLQTSCVREGFNAVCSDKKASKARIGIIADDKEDCSDCDSRIGFGTGGYQDDNHTCGNEATYSSDNGSRHIKAMGYILVQ